MLARNSRPGHGDRSGPARATLCQQLEQVAARLLGEGVAANPASDTLENRRVAPPLQGNVLYRYRDLGAPTERSITRLQQQGDRGSLSDQGTPPHQARNAVG